MKSRRSCRWTPLALGARALSLELRAIAERIGTPYALAKPRSRDALVRMVNRALREKIGPHSHGSSLGERRPPE